MSSVVEYKGMSECDRKWERGGGGLNRDEGVLNRGIIKLI